MRLCVCLWKHYKFHSPVSRTACGLFDYILTDFQFGLALGPCLRQAHTVESLLVLNPGVVLALSGRMTIR